MSTRKLIDIILFRQGVTSEPRFREFLDRSPGWYGKNYWYGLASAYVSSDNLYVYKDEIKAAFAAKRKGKEALMNDEELKLWRNLPAKVDIYRGMTIEEQKSGDFGISWTLSREVAEFFAYEYHRNIWTQNLPKTVHHLNVDKKDVIAYFDERKEKEVIYLHKKSH